MQSPPTPEAFPRRAIKALRWYFSLYTHPSAWVRVSAVCSAIAAMVLFLSIAASIQPEEPDVSAVAPTAGPTRTPTPGLERIAVVAVWLRENFEGTSWFPLIQKMNIRGNSTFEVTMAVRNDAEGRAFARPLCNTLTAYVARSSEVVEGITLVVIRSANGDQMLLGSRSKDC